MGDQRSAFRQGMGVGCGVLAAFATAGCLVVVAIAVFGIGSILAFLGLTSEPVGAQARPQPREQIERNVPAQKTKAVDAVDVVDGRDASRPYEDDGPAGAEEEGGAMAGESAGPSRYALEAVAEFRSATTAEQIESLERAYADIRLVGMGTALDLSRTVADAEIATSALLIDEDGRGGVDVVLLLDGATIPMNADAYRPGAEVKYFGKIVPPFNRFGSKDLTIEASVVIVEDR